MNANNLTPFGSRVILKVIDSTEQTSNGIIMPTTKNERLQEGIVIAVGEGKRDSNGNLLPMHVKVGDKVVFGKFACIELSKDTETFVAVVDEEIVGVLG